MFVRIAGKFKNGTLRTISHESHFVYRINRIFPTIADQSIDKLQVVAKDMSVISTGTRALTILVFLVFACISNCAKSSNSFTADSFKSTKKPWCKKFRFCILHLIWLMSQINNISNSNQFYSPAGFDLRNNIRLVPNFRLFIAQSAIRKIYGRPLTYPPRCIKIFTPEKSCAVEVPLRIDVPWKFHYAWFDFWPKKRRPPSND